MPDQLLPLNLHPSPAAHLIAFVTAIKYKDPEFGETRLQIGREVAEMTDQEIIDLYNDTLKAEAELVRNNKYIAIEPPLGSPQMEYHSSSGQWSPRGHVLRCLIEDTAEGEREPVITIDGKEMSWHEFGKAIYTLAGWGMRIEFVPEEETHRRPRLEVREPKN